MEFETITVTPSTPHIGAEIGNIDLTKPLSNRQVQDVHEALLRHGVIFFRDQEIDFKHHVAFARHFGSLYVKTVDGTASQGIEGFPEIRAQHFDANSKRVSGEVWHSDQSCDEIPPLGSILYQKIVPPNGGGDTLFASMYAAYDALSPQMKAFLEPLTAEHDGAIAFDSKGAKSAFPVSVHPVIVRHPETGRKLIYVSPGFTTRIMELPKTESDGLLALLFKHNADPRWQVRFRWTNHSIAFWDNRCTQHFAIWDYWPNVRSGFRVLIKGTARPLPAN